MAHCPADKLSDLEPVLALVRSWPGIREKGPGVFYFKSIPFMHFHEKDGERWADVKNGKTWGEPIKIALNASKTQCAQFQKGIQKRYKAILASSAKK